MDDELLPPRDVQRALGISAGTLWRWRRDGVGPRAENVSAENAKRASYKYWRSEVARWIGSGHGS